MAKYMGTPRSWLEAECLERMWSGHAVARRIGVGAQYLHHYSSGKLKIEGMDLAVAVRLAAAMKMTAEEMLAAAGAWDAKHRVDSGAAVG